MDYYSQLRRRSRPRFAPARWPWWVGFSCLFGALGFLGFGTFGGFEYVLATVLGSVPSLGAWYLFAQDAGSHRIGPIPHLVVVLVNIGWWMFLLRRVYVVDAEPGPAWGRLTGRVFLNLGINMFLGLFIGALCA